MPRTKLLVSALAFALAGASVAQAQTFSGVISFGDSLSDAGQYAAIPPPNGFGAGSFTTNPDNVWAQTVASWFGANGNASLAGGSNFAWGGAPTAFSVPGVSVPLRCVPATLPCRSVAQQITASGAVDPNALYTYWAGANDIFNYVGYAGASLITSAQAQAFTGASATNAVNQIRALQTAGATNIVVFNIPDIGRAPNFNNTTLFPGQASPANAAAISGLTFVYNQTLNAGLASLGDGIIPINVYGLVNELFANPGLYGFSNTTGTACNLALTGGSSLFCTPAAYRSPDANQTYLFADGVHPSGAAHAMLASVVIATISAPGEVSMAAEIPLQVYDDQSRTVNRQIFGAGGRDVGTTSVYGAVSIDRQEFGATANTSTMENNLFSLTFGADFRSSETFSFGAAATLGSSDGDVGGSSIENKEVLLTGYAVGHFGMGYVNASITGGSANLDIVRHIVLGPTVRDEVGSTSATHTGAELGAGFTFGDDSFRHGPFVSATWQKVEVKGYAEDGLDSTAMYFSDFNRKSTVARIGYQAQGDAGGLRPFGRVAYARDTQDRVTRVQAGSNTMNGHFTLDGFPGAQDWIEAELGLDYAVNDSTDVSLSYRARLSDDTQDLKSFNLGFRKAFGAAAAPAPEPVAEVVQTTCSDLDDDSDGVNNCNDKCPTSAAGEAVGADGCPVPAAEPEPVQEAKPFRN